MEEQEEIAYEEVVERSEMDLNALIRVLIDKGIITQKELDKKIDELYPLDEEE